MAKASKEKRIKNETKRLTEIFRNMDPNKLAACQALIARASYITVSLQDLEEELNIYGWTEDYQNGENQTGRKKSASADVHISLTKNLNAIMKQLLDLVPASQKKSKLTEMMTR